MVGSAPARARGSPGTCCLIVKSTRNEFAKGAVGACFCLIVSPFLNPSSTSEGSTFFIIFWTFFTMRQRLQFRQFFDEAMRQCDYLTHLKGNGENRRLLKIITYVSQKDR
jgi:hypothetical protein